MVEEISWTWNEKQVQFITTPARFAAYVGGMGCGKTSAFCRRAIAIAQKYPDSRGLLARYTYPETESTLIPQFFEICPPNLVKKWRRSEGNLELRSGPRGEFTSTIIFRNLEDGKKFRSENLNFFGISQADEPEIGIDLWNELVFRLRRIRGRWGTLPKQYGFLEGNYRGHNWIWQLFTKDGQAGNAAGIIRQASFNPEDYVLIEGKTEENKANLPDDYITDMESMPDDWKNRYMYGSWDEMGGLVYHEFRPHLHVVPGIMLNREWTAKIPDYWYRYRSIDHGSRNPTVCLWATVSPSGTVYIYDEYYRPGLALQHATKIKQRYAYQDPKTLQWIPTERYQFTVIDPSAFNRESTSGDSPAMQYFDAGVPVVKARIKEKDIGASVAVVKRYLAQVDSQTGRPRLQIIGDRCPNLLREIKEYVWEELGPTRRLRRNEPERPRKLRDHAMDALRYLLVSRPSPSPDRPRPTEESSIYGVKPERIYEEQWEV